MFWCDWEFESRHQNVKCGNLRSNQVRLFTLNSRANRKGESYHRSDFVSRAAKFDQFRVDESITPPLADET